MSVIRPRVPLEGVSTIRSRAYQFSFCLKRRESLSHIIFERLKFESHKHLRSRDASPVLTVNIKPILTTSHLVTFSRHPGFSLPVFKVEIMSSINSRTKNIRTPMATQFSLPPVKYTNGKVSMGRIRNPSMI